MFVYVCVVLSWDNLEILTMVKSVQQEHYKTMDYSSCNHCILTQEGGSRPTSTTLKGILHINRNWKNSSKVKFSILLLWQTRGWIELRRDGWFPVDFGVACLFEMVGNKDYYLQSVFKAALCLIKNDFEIR